MIRLLKVVAQPVYVRDDGDDLTEVPVQPVTLSAAQWRALDPTAWAEQGAQAVEEQLTSPPGGAPKPSREPFTATGPHGPRTIYPMGDGTFTVADDGGWIEGSYDTVEEALSVPAGIARRVVDA